MFLNVLVINCIFHLGKLCKTQKTISLTMSKVITQIENRYQNLAKKNYIFIFRSAMQSLFSPTKTAVKSVDHLQKLVDLLLWVQLQIWLPNFRHLCHIQHVKNTIRTRVTQMITQFTAGIKLTGYIWWKVQLLSSTATNGTVNKA